MRAFSTIAVCGFVTSFYWATMFYDIPANARQIEMPSVAGLKRVIDAMPTPDTFLGIREVFKQIDKRLGSR